MSQASELQDVIRKHLPAEVCSLLRAEHEELHQLRGEKERLTKELSSLNALSRHQQEQITAHGSLQARELALSAREEQLTERENAQKVFEAEIKARASEDKAQTVVRLFEIVFKNPVMQSATYGSVPMTPSANGLCPTSQPFNFNTTTEPR